MNNKILSAMVVPIIMLLLVLYQTFIPSESDYGEWSSWSRCMKYCGPSWQGRHRNCSTGYSVFGKPCIKKSRVETRPCEIRGCPIDGKPSKWSEWQPCKIECKDSTMERVRYCNNPPPKHNGFHCYEPLIELKRCPSTVMCPIDGINLYYGYTECSKTCGGGVKSRPRHCQPPQYGEKPCNPNDPLEQKNFLQYRSMPKCDNDKSDNNKSENDKIANKKSKNDKNDNNEARTDNSERTYQQLGYLN